MIDGDREREKRGPGGGYRVVGRFLSAPDAELAASALEAAGIEARLRDQHTVGVNWLWSLALGGVAVEVPEGQWAEAAEILETAGPQAEPLSSVEEEAYATGLERRRWRGLWAIFLIAPWLWLLCWPLWGRGRRAREDGES